MRRGCRGAAAVLALPAMSTSRRRPADAAPGVSRRRWPRLLFTLAIAASLLACTSLPVAAPPAPTSTSTFAPSAALLPAPSDTPAPPPSETPTPAPPTVTATPVPTVERVLIISLDGLRPDALDPGRTPNILALATRGAYSWRAQTVLPSATLPAHGSMLSGFDVADHGLTWNDYIPAYGHILTPTIFSAAHAAGLRTVMLAAKPKLVQCAAPGTLDVVETASVGDFAIAERAMPHLAAGFGVFFLHFAGPDAAGHQSGWMSSSYLQTVGNTDIAVGRVLEALAEAGMAETTLVILTADHGGHDRVHGSSRAEDTTIPWIVAGPGVRRGHGLAADVRVQDTAATALWALGLPLPEGMSGRPLLEAFESAAR